MHDERRIETDTICIYPHIIFCHLHKMANQLHRIFRESIIFIWYIFYVQRIGIYISLLSPVFMKSAVPSFYFFIFFPRLLPPRRSFPFSAPVSSTLFFRLSYSVFFRKRLPIHAFHSFIIKIDRFELRCRINKNFQAHAVCSKNYRCSFSLFQRSHQCIPRLLKVHFFARVFRKCILQIIPVIIVKLFHFKIQLQHARYSAPFLFVSSL